MIKFPAILCKDAYKVFHVHAYKPGVTHVYSNFTNRNGRLSNIKDNKDVVFVGLQYFIKNYLQDSWNRTFFSVPKEEAVGEYKRVISAMLGKPVDVKHLEALHDLGYLPLEIKAVEEGTPVPYGVPSLTIVNTVEGFGWLTNMIETVMSAEIWPICTAATTAFAYRKRFENTPIAKEMIPFMGHDFSYRGAMGTQAAAMNGFGHLCSFVGSDTIPAALFAEKYYGACIDKELVFASVDATEHSVMCSYGTEGELDSLRHLMTNVTPTGILSVVSDTWDFWKLVTEYIPALKSEILAREGTVVIRPDSGDPVDILCGDIITDFTDDVEEGDLETFKLYAKDALLDIIAEETPYGKCGERRSEGIFKLHGKYYKVAIEIFWVCHDKQYYYIDGTKLISCEEVELAPEQKGLVECLWDIFGGTMVEWQGKEYKLLDSHIGAIYGDSITLERQEQIIKRLMDKGFVPSVVLGIGSYTYQYVTRDTHGSAVKATCVQFGEGNYQPIFKDPKTDKKKKSAKGLLCVTKNENGELVLESDVTPEREKESLLTTVFKDGKLVRETTLQEIRDRMKSYL